MIIILKPNSDKEKIKDLLDSLKSRNIGIHYSEGKFVDIIGLIGDTSHLDINSVMASSDIIETVKRVSEPYKAVNRKFHPDDTVVDGGGAKLGGQNFSVIAGPCSVESEEQMICIAKSVKKSGAKLLRGGAFKPRTSPYSFQGLHDEGIRLLLEAKKETGLPIVTEIMSLTHIDLFADVDFTRFQVQQIFIACFFRQKDSAFLLEVDGFHRQYTPVANRAVFHNLGFHIAEAAIRIAQENQAQHGHTVFLTGQLALCSEQVGGFPQLAF